MRIVLDRRSAAISAMLVALLLAAASPAEADAPTPADLAEARAGLAEHIAELAENTLRLGALTEPAFRESAALLEAAGRVNPSEPRFPRLLVSAENQLQSVDGQIAAWTAYRRLMPDDRDAQQQLIDLYVTKMETADAKLRYLRSLIDKNTIPDEVRAHIAAECIPLLMDRSKDEAIAMAAVAKKLYPLPEVLNWEYELVGKTASVPQRVRSLLGIIKANPAQPKRVAELAHLLAANDLATAALEWYAIAINLDNRGAQVPSHSLAVDYVAELSIANETQAAESVVGRLLQVAPDDPDFWFLRLTLLRGAGEQVALSQTLGLAKDSFVRRVAIVNDQILGKARSRDHRARHCGSTDPSAAIASLKAQDRPELHDAFVFALDNLAWFEVYYDQQSDAAAPWITALKALLPPDDFTLNRLQGWQNLVAGNTKAAKDALQPHADTDPLSALGLIRLSWPDRQNPPPADAAQLKAKLLADYRTGVIGAVLREGLSDSSSAAAKPPASTEPAATQPATAPAALAPLAVPLETASGKNAQIAVAATAPSTQPAADPISAELEKFPRDLLGILDQPSRFYSLRAEPLHTSIHFSDPLFARVTIKNIGNYDIFVGSDGLLQPHLWFNAQVKGIVTQSFPGVVYDRIANVTVLRPKATTTQVIRLDQGELGEALLQHATDRLSFQELC